MWEIEGHSGRKAALLVSMMETGVHEPKRAGSPQKVREARTRFSPRASREELSPANILISARWHQRQTADLHNYTLIDLCGCELRRLWSLVIAAVGCQYTLLLLEKPGPSFWQILLLVAIEWTFRSISAFSRFDSIVSFFAWHPTALLINIFFCLSWSDLCSCHVQLGVRSYLLI